MAPPCTSSAAHAASSLRSSRLLRPINAVLKPVGLALKPAPLRIHLPPIAVEGIYLLGPEGPTTRRNLSKTTSLLPRLATSLHTLLPCPLRPPVPTPHDVEESHGPSRVSSTTPRCLLSRSRPHQSRHLPPPVLGGRETCPTARSSVNHRRTTAEPPPSQPKAQQDSTQDNARSPPCTRTSTEACNRHLDRTPLASPSTSPSSPHPTATRPRRRRQVPRQVSSRTPSPANTSRQPDPGPVSVSTTHQDPGSHAAPRRIPSAKPPHHLPPPEPLPFPAGSQTGSIGSTWPSMEICLR
ncbi:proteoglycan 4-like [Centruroides sculpturatus]|uniref:proteoglycan 4-like n=1 Tax=Centruroides sculpturatus TaxID=218467 RepID=UPI000C6ED33C|nr:proteoglycan 4-like [Centruroides sculpturatus]